MANAIIIAHAVRVQQRNATIARSDVLGFHEASGRLNNLTTQAA